MTAAGKCRTFASRAWVASDVLSPKGMDARRVQTMVELLAVTLRLVRLVSHQPAQSFVSFKAQPEDGLRLFSSEIFTSCRSDASRQPRATYPVTIDPKDEIGAEKMEDWVWQMQNHVSSLDALQQYIHVTAEEKAAIETLNTRWGTTPYFASLMDADDPNCPVRRQVVPSLKEKENRFGMDNYLVWKENRDTEEVRPDSIARQYRDRVAFTVSDVCANYCRHCFRKELIVSRQLELKFDVDEGLEWIRAHREVRDVLITGGDPFLFDDEQIAYLVNSLRAIAHIRMIRFHTRVPVVLPQRITLGLQAVLNGFHPVPIWINIQVNHAREITEQTAKAVYDLLRCGINIGNQGVLLKGINDDVQSFRELHQKLLEIRVRPYYMFYCEPAPGIDHFRTPVVKGAELIRDALQGHTSGLAVPRYVVATRIGKIPLMPDYYILDRHEGHYILQNYQGKRIEWPDMPE